MTDTTAAPPSKLDFALTSLADCCMALEVDMPNGTGNQHTDIKVMLLRAFLSVNYWQPDGTMGDGTPRWKQEFPAEAGIPVRRGSIRYALQQIAETVPFDA